ncbi:MAG: Fur family transcriptional regulator [Blastocatellia bacterium]
MVEDVARMLESHGVQPSAHRVAVAGYVLSTTEHPSADQVLAKVKATFPFISRATVYNTLNLFVEKHLLRELYLAEGKVVFDPKMDRHHHFIDEDTGAIHDVPWDQVQVCNIENLDAFDISDYQVVITGRRKE